LAGECQRVEPDEPPVHQLPGCGLRLPIASTAPLEGQPTTMTDATDLTPEQIADLKRQLKAVNDGLLAIERRREELQAYIATLTAQPTPLIVSCAG
jgi:hypothetical protein